MIRRVIKRLLSPVLKRASAYYLKKPRTYSYKDISVVVAPTVFPPFITISTKLLIEFAETLPLEGKTFLELGCGCGILSVLAARKGAIVTATDINNAALAQLQRSAAANEVHIEILFSDLFENLQDRHFDYIFINPPYYPKDPASVSESAWFCGSDFGYFKRLFPQLVNFMPDADIYMILSEDCDLDQISLFAKQNGILLVGIRQVQKWGEKNFIFLLRSEGL